MCLRGPCGPMLQRLHYPMNWILSTDCTCASVHGMVFQCFSCLMLIRRLVQLEHYGSEAFAAKMEWVEGWSSILRYLHPTCFEVPCYLSPKEKDYVPQLTFIFSGRGLTTIQLVQLPIWGHICLQSREKFHFGLWESVASAPEDCGGERPGGQDRRIPPHMLHGWRWTRGGCCT